MNPGRIVLTPVGSAGDFDPFVMLGGELRRRGHRVTLIASEPFAGAAASAGLEFEQVGTTAEYEQTIANPDLWDARRGPRVVFEEVGRHLQRAYDAVARAYTPGGTLLVGHALSFPTRVFEELHPVPAATVQLSPSVFRSDFAQPAMPDGADISRWPRWLKRAVWWGIDRFAIDPLIVPALNAWRATLGLPPVHRVLKAWMHSPQCVLGLFPDWFGEPQCDWPPQTRLTGFVLSDAACGPDDAAAAASLERFLADGAPPVVFTPGTAHRHAAGFFAVAAEASARARLRALFVTSHREQLPHPLPPHVHHAVYAPFATLFPRVAAVVHHGGIGTTAQALAAGVPQIVMPMGFDQPDNGARTARLGVGAVIRAPRFEAAAVAASLERLLSSEEVSAACRHVRGRIDGRRALAAACDALEQVAAGAMLTGGPSRHPPARSGCTR